MMDADKVEDILAKVKLIRRLANPDTSLEHMAIGIIGALEYILYIDSVGSEGFKSMLDEIDNKLQGN